MQLAGVDPELLRPLRARVDLADKTLRGSSDHAQRSSAQAELEALAVEIRRIRGS
jgi:HAMP domain-containing protein